MTRPRAITRFQLLDVLRREITRDGSLRATARRLKITPAYLSDVMRGRRDPGPKVLEPLGYFREPLPALRYRKAA